MRLCKSFLYLYGFCVHFPVVIYYGACLKVVTILTRSSCNYRRGSEDLDMSVEMLWVTEQLRKIQFDQGLRRFAIWNSWVTDIHGHSGNMHQLRYVYTSIRKRNSLVISTILSKLKRIKVACSHRNGARIRRNVGMKWCMTYQIAAIRLPWVTFVVTRLVRAPGW